MLRDALYRGVPKDVSSIHLELAAILAASMDTPRRRLHGLYTFNFDERQEDFWVSWQMHVRTGALLPAADPAGHQRECTPS